MSEKSVSLFLSSVFSFCEKLFELQEKYSDKIHKAVKCLHINFACRVEISLFKTAQVASTFSQTLLCLFETKRKRKKKEKKKKTRKSVEIFSGYDGRALSLQPHFEPKRRDKCQGIERNSKFTLTTNS